MIAVTFRETEPAMIAVIADDLAGAAELGGIGFTHGLSSEVYTTPDIRSAADLVVVDADSRSCPAEDAARRAAQSVRTINPHRPAWIFKKVDSVLRGPVLAEVRAVLAAMGMRRAILVPANPSRGRIIRDGQYFVEGRPIDQTPFAADPEHPAQSAKVLELLGATGGAEVCVRRPEQDLPESGIIVGEATTPEEISLWAQRVGPSVLPAGAADFFAAQLTARGLCYGEPPHVPEATSAPSGIAHDTLFVCGSAAAWETGRGGAIRKRGIPVVLLPPDSLPDGSRQAAHAAVAALKQHGTAMMAIGSQPESLATAPRSRLEHLLEAVTQVLQARQAGRLFVEGGGTASVLMRRMGWTHTRVFRQYAPGVVALQVDARPPVVVTVKPGSYPWPDAVWRMPDCPGTASEAPPPRGVSPEGAKYDSPGQRPGDTS
jgi:uncharacterized protein YgbK (DUF1537 family)